MIPKSIPNQSTIDPKIDQGSKIDDPSNFDGIVSFPTLKNSQKPYENIVFSKSACFASITLLNQKKTQTRQPKSIKIESTIFPNTYAKNDENFDRKMTPK